MFDPTPDLNEKITLKSQKYKISKVTCRFVNKLLIKNPAQRLGSKLNVQDIKKEQFFSGIDFLLIENGDYKPPIIPNKVNI